MEIVKVYGFGSFFKNPNEAHDIDLLLLHENSSEKSCQFAIACKIGFSSKLPRPHITLLSVAEEYQNNFIEKSNATLLGEIREQVFEADIASIICNL
jgi:hypothetical protein